MSEKLSERIADQVETLLFIETQLMDDERLQKQCDAGRRTIMNIIKEEITDRLGSEILNLIEARGYDLSRLDQDDVLTIISRKVI